MAETEEEFFGRLASTVENGYTCLAIAVGHNLGLFDLIADFASEEIPKTSAEIAEKGNFKERYVREWLGAMVTGRMLECDPAGKKFWIPKHRVNALRKRSPDMVEPGILVGLASAIPMFGSVEPEIKECFRKNGPGGVGYDKFEYFSQFMSDLSGSWQHKHLLKNFIPQVPELQGRFESVGLKALDIGCGHGTPSIILATKFPKSEFYGIDFSDDVIAEAKKNAKDCPNTHFVSMDAAHLPAEWSEMFDYVTAFDAIHDQAYPDKVLKEIHRVLKPSGFFSMLDLKGKGNPYLDKTETPLSALNYSARDHSQITSAFETSSIQVFVEKGEEVQHIVKLTDNIKKPPKEDMDLDLAAFDRNGDGLVSRFEVRNTMTEETDLEFQDIYVMQMFKYFNLVNNSGQDSVNLEKWMETFQDPMSLHEYLEAIRRGRPHARKPLASLSAFTLTRGDWDPILASLIPRARLFIHFPQSLDQDIIFRLVYYHKYGFPQLHMDSTINVAKPCCKSRKLNDEDCKPCLWATVLLYLNDVPPGRGGQTVFPFNESISEKELHKIFPKVRLDKEMCNRPDYLKIEPKSGKALINFHHYETEDPSEIVGRPDPYAYHAACPVSNGEKYIATMWIPYE